MAHMAIDRGVGAGHPFHDVLDVANNGQMVFGGIEQFAQQLALARVHLAEEGLTIGRLGGAVDQANQPGPHAMADWFEQCGYQSMQFALG